jgi:predicted patatin/cPLA2 family phospholipase
MRSIFSAGLLDGFLEQGFNPFDFYIGVSAGASNLAAYLAGTPKMSLQFFQEFALDKSCFNYWRFMRGGHLIDLDWLAQVAFSESHLDLKAIYRHGKPLYVCVTDVATGNPVYVDTRLDNIGDVIKASTALPVFYRGFPEVAGRAMTDGGVAEGVPVAEAIRKGAKHIMVIRSRHKDYLKRDTLSHLYIRGKMKAYPALLSTMRRRTDIHRDSIRLLRNPPSGVKFVEVCPPENLPINRFSRGSKQLLQAYQIGLEATDSVIAQWDALSA